MRTALTVLALASCGAGLPAGLVAQHEHSPYAGMQTAEGTALTPDEVSALRAAEGMRLALPAELNRYPGPRHVLELGDDMGLSDATIARVEAIRDDMAAAARAKGEEVIEAERALFAVFRYGGATPTEVASLTAALAKVRGELQAIHLSAHLRTRALLDDAQVARYQELRGY